jgi:hypothetical protein
MRFVEMWILGRLTTNYHPLELLLLERRSLREQWNSPCRGITPRRVIDGIIALSSKQHVSILQLQDECSEPSDPFFPSSSEIRSISTETVEEIIRHGWRVTITRFGYESWEKWAQYDWAAHVEVDFDWDGHPSVASPGWINVRAASCQKLMYAVRHLQESHGLMILSDSASCSIAPSWAVNDFITLPLCFDLRARAVQIDFIDDNALRAEEDVGEQLWAKWEEVLAQWQFRGANELPFVLEHPLHKL